MVASLGALETEAKESASNRIICVASIGSCSSRQQSGLTLLVVSEWSGVVPFAVCVKYLVFRFILSVRYLAVLVESGPVSVSLDVGHVDSFGPLVMHSGVYVQWELRVQYVQLVSV